MRIKCPQKKKEKKEGRKEGNIPESEYFFFHFLFRAASELDVGLGG